MPERTLGLNSLRPSSADGMESAALAALDTAVALARRGERQRARQLCAAVVFEAQPIIVCRKELLRATLHALLVAHGFKLLSRVVMATSGHSVRVVLLSEPVGQIVSPCSHQGTGATIYTLDPCWLARLTPDDMFLQHWCDALIAGGLVHPAAVAAAPVPLSLQPG